LTAQEVGDLAAERVDAVFEALIEHVADCGSFDASTRDATPPILAAGQVQGVTAGTSHGAGISTVPKLAGPATSKYSMSFEWGYHTLRTQRKDDSVNAPPARPRSPMALGGFPLLGDRVLRVVYLDIAGLANPNQEPFTVVAGVIINPDKQWISINKYLSDIADEYVGRTRPFDFYFHATELFHGTKNFPRNKYDKETRFKILDRLVEIPRLFDSPIVWGHADRRLFAKGAAHCPPPHISPLAAASSVAYSISASATEHWMKEIADSDEVAMLVMENDDQCKKLVKRTHRLMSDEKLRPFLEQRAHDLILHRLMYPVHFEEKTDSSALQIADVCAFSLKRYLMKAPEFERFYGPLEPNLVNRLVNDVHEVF
jgi:hypothetical protein